MIAAAIMAGAGALLALAAEIHWRHEYGARARRNRT